MHQTLCRPEDLPVHQSSPKRRKLEIGGPSAVADYWLPRLNNENGFLDDISIFRPVIGEFFAGTHCFIFVGWMHAPSLHWLASCPEV